MQSGVQLHRVIKLNDRFGTHVFTFILPKTLGKVMTRDVSTREFLCGNQKWFATFICTDTHVGAYLNLKNATEGMKVTTDFSITLLNRVHFTRNETYLEKGFEFTKEKPAHGRKTFVGISDLTNRDFAQDTGEYVIEVEIRNVKTLVDLVIQIPKDKLHNIKQHEYPKFETSFFTFGGFEWHVTVHPNGESRENRKPFISLTKLSNFDHFCKVKYRVQVGPKERMLDSGVLTHLFDTGGGGDVFYLKCNLYQLMTTKGRLNVRLECHSVQVISFLEIPALDRKKSAPSAHCYDREKQAWLLETDIKGQYLKLKLYYTDIKQVPRGYSRYVCWKASVIPAYGTTGEIKATGSPFSSSFVQKELHDGYEMMTNIQVKKLTEPDNIFVFEENKCITIQVEWVDSYLLMHSTYHLTDNLVRMQKQQMSREVLALQTENYALEKQLHSYQQSIAKTSSNNGGSRRGSVSPERIPPMQDQGPSLQPLQRSSARAGSTPHLAYSDAVDAYHSDSYYPTTTGSGRNSRRSSYSADPYLHHYSSSAPSHSTPPSVAQQLLNSTHSARNSPRNSIAQSANDGYHEKYLTDFQGNDQHMKQVTVHDKYGPLDKYPTQDKYGGYDRYNPSDRYAFTQDKYAPDRYPNAQDKVISQEKYAAQDKHVEKVSQQDRYTAQGEKYSAASQGKLYPLTTQQKYVTQDGTTNQEKFSTDKYLSSAAQDKYAAQDKFGKQDKHAIQDRHGNSQDRYGNQDKYGPQDKHMTTDKYGSTAKQDKYGAQDKYGTHDKYETQDKYGTHDKYETQDKYGAQDKYGTHDKIGTHDKYIYDTKYSTNDKYPSKERYSAHDRHMQDKYYHGDKYPAEKLSNSRSSSRSRSSQRYYERDVLNDQ